VVSEHSLFQGIVTFLLPQALRKTKELCVLFSSGVSNPVSAHYTPCTAEITCSVGCSKEPKSGRWQMEAF
jgi:hypothetical protein